MESFGTRVQGFGKLASGNAKAIAVQPDLIKNELLANSNLKLLKMEPLVHIFR